MAGFAMPETRYALSGDVNIAYQTLGDGPVDIIGVPGLCSHIEFAHEFAGYTTFLRRLSKFARVVTFDKRGQGLSDRIAGAPSLEQRMDDMRAIMDEIGSKRTILMGHSEGCPMSILFAATYPERVSHLILFGGFANAADLVPPGVTQEKVEAYLTQRVRSWGNGDLMKTVMPSQAQDQNAVALMGKFERLASSPGALKTIQLLNSQIDVTSILPTVQVPTLVLHRKSDAVVPVALGRKLAKQIPNAKYIEYPGGDHAFWTGDTDTLLGDIEEFITGHRDGDTVELERILATVMFTDIVDSTRRAAEMGDQRWRALLDHHDQLAQRLISKHRGSLVKSTGDGVLAIFDGPGRAIRCALAFSAAAQQIGLPLRAGLHTGEIELRGEDIGGIAVHAAARVLAQSAANEVLVSRVVTDLVAGAGLKFGTRGSYELKGLPGRWELFAASQ
ncbi:adenylate/guanylate cyclase domain-containing protein [Bradyrhizobium sp. WSM 1738]|uniref:adenylate/guanylate cyclase domain-containing protein n=1 Tax=Bradyrhizobium hereditatis TaxID=2821405 RepID=UPI001CE3629B|nr:adenylate/guanylate cyclase domain-containing protein [Bradyrhizobium hereditatis]MCA6119940.1 adenylate/guanylate cyclase domain-containing protein [Bradyrhizobium hereditatis]